MSVDQQKKTQFFISGRPNSHTGKLILAHLKRKETAAMDFLLKYYT